MIPLLVLFIGIIMPLKIHAAELKETDESIVNWNTAKIETITTSDNMSSAKYTLGKEPFDFYDAALNKLARYAIDLVGDRKEKEDLFNAYIPVEITTDKVLDETSLHSGVREKVKNWMMFGNEVSKHEILSFSYSRSGGYENLKSLTVWFHDIEKTDTGYTGTVRISATYAFSQDFFQKYETGVQNAVKDMDVAGKSDYDKAYAVCKWIQSNPKRTDDGRL